MTNKEQKRKKSELEEIGFGIPNRIERIWNEVKFPLLWSSVAVASLSILVFSSVSHKGGDRLAMLPFEVQDMLQKREPGTSLAAMLDQRLGQVNMESAKLAAARVKLEQRIATLEENYSDITASIPNRATVPAPVAATVAPQAGNATIQKTIPADVISKGALTIATRTEFGIELATDQTMGNLRTRWVKLMDQFGATMGGYEPLISASDGDKGVVLHLVVGPFANAQEAAQACAKLRVAGIGSCTPVPYDGQRLALR